MSNKPMYKSNATDEYRRKAKDTRLPEMWDDELHVYDDYKPNDMRKRMAIQRKWDRVDARAQGLSPWP
jgi:hypothetical protein